MPNYCYRVWFQLPGNNVIGCDDAELLIGSDSEGATVRLKSGGLDSPIRAHSSASLVGGPYPTEESAVSAASNAQRALLVWAVNRRTGVDLGGGPSRSVVTAYGLQQLEQQTGRPCRSAIRGVDVHECREGLLYMTFAANAQIGYGSDAFRRQVSSSLSTSLSVSDRLRLGCELLSASYFDASDRSRFVTQITAVEALLAPAARPADAQDLVETFIRHVKVSGLDASTKQAMTSSLAYLKRESIGQAGRALAGSLLPGAEYFGMSAPRFFAECYEMRSAIVHRGSPERASDELPQRYSEAHRFVADLFIAALNAGS
jgi:hypothetical protein